MKRRDAIPALVALSLAAASFRATAQPGRPDPALPRLDESLIRAGRPVTFHRYGDSGHWFFEPDRARAYNETAARLACDRTLDFLTRVN